MTHIITVLISILIPLTCILLVREGYIVFEMYRIAKNSNGKADTYYVPLFGVWWKMLLKKDKENEWLWIRELADQIDKKGKEFIVSNNILWNKPLIIIIGGPLIAEIFKKEL